MDSKTMPQTKNCDLCSHKHSCKDVYEQLGKTKGPGITFTVLIAFVVPIVVFIVSLAVFGKLSANISHSEKLANVIIFLLSLTVTTLVMLVIKLIKFNLKK